MSRIHLALAVFALASFAPAAFADEAVGPKFGNNSYAASIAGEAGRADTDDYVASLAAGERIVVRVSAAKGSSLLPALTLVSPDGTEFVPPAIVATKGGKSVALRGYVVPTTGRWAVRARRAARVPTSSRSRSPPRAPSRCVTRRSPPRRTCSSRSTDSTARA
jgi:hypothetical protein